MSSSSFTEDEIKIYTLLQQDGPLTKNELAGRLGTNYSSLNRNVVLLLTKRLIIEHGQEPSSGGRRPSLYDIDASQGYIIGIDITRVSLAVAICDLKMRLVAKGRPEVKTNEFEPGRVTDGIARCVNELLEEKNIPKEKILGAGLGMTGPVDPMTGITGRVHGHLLDGAWDHIPIRDMLEEKLGCPVYVDDGSCAAVTGEYIYGTGKHLDRVAYIICGRGIRAGYINGGTLVRGPHNEEDALAHVSINMRGSRCYCGRRGCLGLYASSVTIARNIRQRIAQGEKTSLDVPPEQINYIKYCAAAEAGDKVCKEELAAAGAFFGVGLANYITILDPQLVIVGGALAVSTDIFYKNAVEVANRESYHSANCRVQFKQGGSQGAWTTAVGAAAMYYEKIMGSPNLSGFLQ